MKIWKPTRWMPVQETGMMLLFIFYPFSVHLPVTRVPSFYPHTVTTPFCLGFLGNRGQNGRIFLALCSPKKGRYTACYLWNGRCIADYIGVCIDGYFQRMYWSSHLRSSLSGRLWGWFVSGVMGRPMEKSRHIWADKTSARTIHGIGSWKIMSFSFFSHFSASFALSAPSSWPSPPFEWNYQLS